jgi:hypothetical protein
LNRVNIVSESDPRAHTYLSLLSQSIVGTIQNVGLIENAAGGQYQKEQGKFINKTAASVFSILLISVSFLFVSIGVDKRGEGGNPWLFVVAAWPIAIIAVWVFLACVLDWHGLELSDNRSKNVGVLSIVIPELELSDI